MVWRGNSLFFVFEKFNYWDFIRDCIARMAKFLVCSTFKQQPYRPTAPASRTQGWMGRESLVGQGTSNSGVGIGHQIEWPKFQNEPGNGHFRSISTSTRRTVRLYLILTLLRRVFPWFFGMPSRIYSPKLNLFWKRPPQTRLRPRTNPLYTSIHSRTLFTVW